MPLSSPDKGFSKGIGDATKKTSAFADTIKGLGSIGGGIGGALKSAFRLPDVRTIAGHIQNLADDYKITTTQVEAFGIASSKVTSATLAGMNMTSKQMGKAKSQIAGIAYGLNMDAGSVAQSYKALEQSGIGVDNVYKLLGVSFADYNKFIAVSGVDTTKFAAMLGKMRSQFHMSDKQIKDTVTSVIALGKRFNMGSEAAQSMSNTVGMLADEGATLWAELGPEKTKAFLEGTQQLAIAFMHAGHSAEEAQQLALGVGQAMIKSRAGVQQLYNGLAEDLPQAAEVLTENLGSVEDAFKTLQNSPAELTKRLAKAAKAIRDSSKSPQEAQEKLSRFNNQMVQAFGPQFTALISGSLDKTVESFDQVQKELSKPGGLANKNGVLKQMANNYESGLTPAELLARATDQFRTRLKALMGETDSQFLDRFNKSAKITGDKLAEIAKRGGPLGKVTSLMVEFANHGLGGVATKINAKYGPAMAVLIQQFGPVISQLSAAIPLMRAFTSPITLAAAALAGLYFYFKGIGEGGNQFTEMVNKYAKKAWEIFKDVVRNIIKYAPVVFQKIGEAATEIWNSIDWDKVKEYAYKAASALWDLFLYGLNKLFELHEWIVDQLGRIDWNVVGDYVEKGIKQLGPLVAKGFDIALKNLPKLFKINLEATGAIVIAIFKAIGSLLADALEAGWDAATDYIKNKAKNFVSSLWDSNESVGDGGIMGKVLYGEGDGDSMAGSLLYATETYKNQQRVMQDKTKETGELVTKVTGSIGNMTKTVTTELLKLNSVKLDVAKHAVQELADAYAEAPNRLKAGLKVGEDALKAFAAGVAKHQTKITKKTAEGIANVADAQAEVVKSLNVSEEDSTDILKQLIGGNIGKVKEDIKSIGDAYKAFLSANIKSTTETSNTLHVQLTNMKILTIKIYGELSSIVYKFNDDITKAMNRFWTDMIVQATAQSISMFTIVSGLLTSITSIASKMNLLDAMTPQSVIDAWAVKIVATLQRVFSSNLNLAPAIQTALGNIQDLSSQIGITGNSGSSTVPANAAATKVASADNANNLTAMMRTIDRPVWAGEYAAEERIRHDAMLKKIDLLIQVTAFGKKITDKKVSQSLINAGDNVEGNT